MPRRILVAVRIARTHETWWAEMLSGGTAAAVSLFSWAAASPLEEHAILGHVARLVGGNKLEALGFAAGILQLAMVLTDRPPWRWLVAFGMAAWWGIPVWQVLKSDVSAPMVASACAGWMCANLVAVWCLLRPAPIGIRNEP